MKTMELFATTGIQSLVVPFHHINTIFPWPTPGLVAITQPVEHAVGLP